MAELAEKKKSNRTDSEETHTEKAKSSSAHGKISKISGGDSTSAVNDKAVGAPRRKEPVTSSIHVVSMNVNGSSDGAGTADRRKHVISDVISKNSPDVVLFQEFKWRGIRGRTWTKTPIAKKYDYTGNEEASILYDADQFQMTSLAANDLQRPLEELKRKTKISQDFMPLPRCCIRLMESKVSELAEKLKYIVISWHGKSKMPEENKKKEFQYLQVYLNELAERQDVSILVGGDFNIRMSVIKNSVLPEFILYEYTPLKRRLGRIIDFFLSSPTLTVADVKSIDLSDEKETDAKVPNNVLDHDPISATVAPYHRKINPSKDIPRTKYPIHVLQESDRAS